MRVRQRPHHARRHPRRVLSKLRVDAPDDDVEPGKQLGLLIECAVLEDVDLDAGQDAERRELGVELVDELELRAQALRGKAVGDREAG